MKKIIFALCIFWGFAADARPLESKDLQSPLSFIGFGSCSMQRKDQSFWKIIEQQRPDLWIWNGDIIYADGMNPRWRGNEYDYLKADPDYADFAKKVPILGTWDDHDFYGNDSDKNSPYKIESQKLLLDFLGEPAASPRRQQEGVYASYIIGPPGQRVKVVLLDLRYFRDEPIDMLGDAQWKWLEGELASREAELLLLVSSSQILPYQDGGEVWNDVPKSRTRILDLITRSPNDIIILSGDRHFGEMMEVNLPGHNGPVYEFTSSGLTHATPFKWNQKNAYRVGPFYPYRNFGMLKIDWLGSTPDVSMLLYQIDGTLVHLEETKFPAQVKMRVPSTTKR